MSYLELCPVCQRIAKRLVDRALDVTAAVDRGEPPWICAPHLQLVISTLSHRTMAKWLSALLGMRDAGDCPLCEIERQPSGPANEFACALHGGIAANTRAIVQRNLARIAAGERFDQDLFVLRAALILLASVRGTSPIVRIE
ncbi:MAG TPA: hypothetical protein VL284_17945 [Thermoanaerobaculia bacterium]|nr:hypothetical protein [Thermoanaerobaculia bacterium]